MNTLSPGNVSPEFYGVCAVFGRGQHYCSTLFGLQAGSHVWTPAAGFLIIGVWLPPSGKYAIPR